MNATETPISRAAQRLLHKINRREAHRMTQATYDEVVRLGLATFVSGHGWLLTPAGQARVT